jgi:nitroreductase
LETWDAIRSRRNVRTYQDRPLEDGHLRQILEAARRTPSSRNEQRWDLIVVRDRDRLQSLARVWQGSGHVARSAATIAIVAPDVSESAVRESIQYDLGQLTMSIMLAATDLGVGTGHGAVRDQALARDLLAFPESHFCAWLIALGYTTEPMKPIERPSRRPYDEVVHEETW